MRKQNKSSLIWFVEREEKSGTKAVLPGKGCVETDFDEVRNVPIA